MWFDDEAYQDEVQEDAERRLDWERVERPEVRVCAVTGHKWKWGPGPNPTYLVCSRCGRRITEQEEY